MLCRPGPSGALEYLTLKDRGHGDIGFPKGHCDAGEEDLATARRETREETGLAVAGNPWFRRRIEYPVGGRRKVVTYFAARAPAADVVLSSEHESYAWLGLDAARAALRHAALRDVLDAAAVFLKDGALRAGLDPAAAHALLVEHVGSDAPVVRHTALVARTARALAEAQGGVDPDYVEAAAWLHDVGRAKTHSNRHPLEGFRLLAAAGHAGYAPPCLSHYAKGRAPDEIGDDDLAREMFQACDLTTFDPEERVIALADFLAAGDRPARLEERHADLAARYGASDFVDRSLAISQELKREWEQRTGLDLYGHLDL